MCTLHQNHCISLTLSNLYFAHIYTPMHAHARLVRFLLGKLAQCYVCAMRLDVLMCWFFGSRMQCMYMCMQQLEFVDIARGYRTFYFGFGFRNDNVHTQ